jgi:hypothetical protein
VNLSAILTKTSLSNFEFEKRQSVAVLKEFLR